MRNEVSYALLGMTLFVGALKPAQASYVCTGVAGPTDPSTPYFNGELTDAACDISEVQDALGFSIDESLIRGSKTDAAEDVDGNVVSWAQDEFGLGTLTVSPFTNNTGTWTLTNDGVQPLFYVNKWDQGYDIYTYMGGSTTSPFSDSWNGADHSLSKLCGSINCDANTSHVSVYGVVPIPAAVWLFGSGLLGLVGIARKRRS